MLDELINSMTLHELTPKPPSWINYAIRIEEIAQQENIPIELCVQTSSSKSKDLEEELLQTNQDYLEKIELGKEIALIIDKGTVREESLTRN